VHLPLGSSMTDMAHAGRTDCQDSQRHSCRVPLGSEELAWLQAAGTTRRIRGYMLVRPGTMLVGSPRMPRAWKSHFEDEPEKDEVFEALQTVKAKGLHNTREHELGALARDATGRRLSRTDVMERLEPLLADTALQMVTNEARAQLVLGGRRDRVDIDVADLGASDEPRARLALFRADREDDPPSLAAARVQMARCLGVTGVSDEVVCERSRRSLSAEWEIIWGVANEWVERFKPTTTTTPTKGSGGRTRAPRPTVELVYHRDSLDELKLGFWWRTSTRNLISTIADQKDLTIYVGSDGPSDAGRSLHQDLFGQLIAERSSQEWPEVAKEIESAVAELRDTRSAAFLGSIVREMYRAPGFGVTTKTEGDLELAIQRAMTTRSSRGGALARAATYLAFALKYAGKSTRVFSARLHDGLDAAQENRHLHYAWSQSIRYLDLEDRDQESQEGSVPVLRVHGRPADSSTQTLSLGESDFIADEAQRAHAATHVPRHERLVECLRAGPVLFVGTELDEPGVLSALAATKNARQLRFAVVLAPGTPGRNDNRRAADRWLMEARYLHLGIVPIVVDLPQQVQQFLREVGSAVLPEQHDSYADRAGKWWKSWSATSYGSGPAVTDKNERVTLAWDRVLDGLLDRLEDEASDYDDPFQVEVWLRDPPHRTLRLWAATTPPAPDALRGRKLAEYTEHIATRAFALGRPVHEEHDEGVRVATNLLLYGSWDRLPIGVIVTHSPTPHRYLSALIQADELGQLEDALARELDQILDPDFTASRSDDVVP